MRFIAVVVAALVVGGAMGFATASTFAENTPDDMTRICESARLRDLERRECRAMFKAASDQARREAVFRTFDERINGSATISR